MTEDHAGLQARCQQLHAALLALFGLHIMPNQHSDVEASKVRELVRSTLEVERQARQETEQ